LEEKEMAISITALVGSGGTNKRPDVRAIQIGLNRIPANQGGANPPLVADGLYGPATDGAIRNFQSEQNLGVDGKVGPTGETLRRINALLPTNTAQALATEIRDSARITLATTHVSGVSDNANARQNIVDTADGREAARSNYENAPGGTVALQVSLLQMIVDIAQAHTISISELAGGSHSTNSRHYVGVAMDVNRIDSAAVGSGNGPDFMQLTHNLGCDEVLGPGDPGHNTHVHAAQPRP
jgi:hypothetical protein